MFLSFTLACPAWAELKLVLSANVTWTNHRDYFGGFSGAEVSEDGQQITLISDAGYLLRAGMIREGGKLIAMQIEKITRLTDKFGGFFDGKETDSEGLAIDTHGRAFISFEDRHRVVSVDLETGFTILLPKHPDFPEFEQNAGLEALAVHPNGTLYTMPELTALTPGDIPLYAFENDQWRRVLFIPKRGPFLPVGADFADDGLLYVLERGATPLGFRSRIRRFDLDAVDLGEITLLRTGPARFDNLEALSVRQDATGRTRLTLISDDNFLKIQRTQIVEFILSE